MVYDAVWPVVAVAGVVALWLPRGRKRFSAYPAEAYFASAYALFLFTYNHSVIAWAFDRYLFPVLPLLLFALLDWIPRDRRVLWSLAFLSALLSAAAMVGFQNVFRIRLP